MLCGVALHDELAELRAEVGPQVFNDPVTFRAAFDDYIPEGSASTGEVSLLVGAISTGALQRLNDQLALGADPATSIAAQGDLLARDRGTSDSSGCRWALSVLAHATGAVPMTQVLTRPSAPDSVSTVDRPSSPPTDSGELDIGPTRVTPDPAVAPTAATDATQVTSDEPAAMVGGPGPTVPTPDPGRRATGRINPMLIGAVAVLAVVAVIAVVLLFLRDGDSPDDDTTADDTSSTDDDAPGPAGTEEVLDEVEMTDAGKTVQVQLVRDGPDVSVVLLAEVDGEFTEVDRGPADCPYLDISYDATIEDQGDRQIFFGWQNRNTDGFGAYGEVQIDEDMLILYDPGDTPCPTAP
jgi:hypothetical protein